MRCKQADIIYHGSSQLFDCPKCCHSKRIKGGVINWEGDAVFATVP